MPSSSMIESLRGKKVRFGASVLLPLLAVALVQGALAIPADRLKEIPVLEHTLYFFNRQFLGRLFPWLFLISYIHLIRNARIRDALFSLGAISLSLFAFRGNAPLLQAGFLLYFAVSALLILWIKKGVRWSGAGIAAISLTGVLLLKAGTDAYEPYLEFSRSWPSASLWQYFGLALLAKRTLELIPVLIHDLPQARRLSAFSLAGYLSNPAFLIHHIPVPPSEYESSFRGPEGVLQGWKNVALAVLLNAVSLTLRDIPWIMAFPPSWYFIENVTHIVVYIVFTTGVIQICGYSIRDSFAGIFTARTPTEIFNFWNIYWREWVMRVAYFPALRAVPSFYFAFTWCFLVSGLRHCITNWFLSIPELPISAVDLWIFAPWLSLILFLHRKIRKRYIPPAWLPSVPAVILRPVQWCAAYLLFMVPALIRSSIFPTMEW